MPELPEVETLKLGLQKYLIGHTIVDIDPAHPQIFEGDKSKIIGGKVVDIKRVGKGLIINLDNGYSLGIHIKLTGQLIYRDDKTKDMPVSPTKVGTLPNPFTHVIFHLDDHAKLYYNDQRRFGWIRVVSTDDVMNMPFFKGMGPEPFKDLTLEAFRQIVANKPTKIKPLLMDQARIGGIGNIYANDALYLSKMSPSRSGKDLSPEDVELLYEAIMTVLKKGLESHGASELNYVNALGQEGEYQNHALVYGKRGKLCSNKCGDKINFIKIAGRGTYYCPTCQAV